MTGPPHPLREVSVLCRRLADFPTGVLGRKCAREILADQRVCFRIRMAVRQVVAAWILIDVWNDLTHAVDEEALAPQLCRERVGLFPDENSKARVE